MEIVILSLRFILLLQFILSEMGRRLFLLIILHRLLI
nr:MAG TPA: hypothetical protein [Caudoviricetes sp.]